MIIVKVWCMPLLGEKEFLKISGRIVNAVKVIPETGVRDEKDMLVLFPTDMMVYGLGQEVLIEIDGIATNHLNTTEEEKLTRNIGEVIKRHVPGAKVFAIVSAKFNSKNRAMWISD